MFALGSSGYNLKPYTGSKSEIFSDWYEKLKDCTDLEDKNSEDEKLKIFRCYLDGPARKFYTLLTDNSETPVRTLREMITQFESKYENNWTKDLARNQLSTCFMCENESVTQFTDRFRSIAEQAFSGEQPKVMDTRMLEEYRDRLLPNLALHVRTSRCTNFQDAERSAIEMESFLKIMKRRTDSSVSNCYSQVQGVNGCFAPNTNELSKV
jgi:hypothetical protein